MTGCSSASTPAVSDAAVGFYRAVSAHRGQAACALLAPETVHELVQTASAPCRTAILEEDLPEPGGVLSVERFGNQAQVRLQGDTVFVAEFSGGWRIVALSCTPRRSLPYDCEVKS